MLILAGAWTVSAAAAPSEPPSPAVDILSQPATRALADAAADGILDLAEAKRIALADNPDVAAAMARVEMAAALVRQSQAAYFPTVSVSASVRHTEDTSLDLGGGAEVPAYRTYTLAGSTSWLVFDGFASQFRVAAARHNQTASRESARDVQRLLLQGVAIGVS